MFVVSQGRTDKIMHDQVLDLFLWVYMSSQARVLKLIEQCFQKQKPCGSRKPTRSHPVQRFTSFRAQVVPGRVMPV